MKKQTCTTAFFSALLITAITVPLLINDAVANWLVPIKPAPHQPSLAIESPQSNKNYATSHISLNFVIAGPGWEDYQLNMSISYNLDGEEYEKYAGSLNSQLWSGEINCLYNLTGLSDGTHVIQVAVRVFGKYSSAPYTMDNFDVTAYSKKVYFTVNTQPPAISILPLENLTAYTSDTTVEFTLNKDVSWVGYSLNGKDFTEINKTSLVRKSTGPQRLWRGNFTLTGLSSGVHSLVVCARDTEGRIGNSTISFTVAQPSATTQIKPLVPVAGSVAAVAVIAGLLFFFKKKERPP